LRSGRAAGGTGNKEAVAVLGAVIVMAEKTVIFLGLHIARIAGTSAVS
jgi:hypothetical protein